VRSLRYIHYLDKALNGESTNPGTPCGQQLGAVIDSAVTSVGSEYRTRTPLADLKRDPKLSEGFSRGRGHHHFPK
jgi:hypothetical protein